MPKQKGIKYHIDNARDRQEQERLQNDPMSPMFLPLRERSGIDQARWWAGYGKKKNDSKFYAEFD